MNTELTFADIDDAKPVRQYKSEDSAQAKLLKAYDVYAQRIDRLPNLTDSLTGAELKAAIASMDPEDQVRLAYLYYVYKGSLADGDEPVAAKEERAFKHWVIKKVVWAMMAVFAVGVGSVATFIYKDKGGEQTGTVISGLFTTAAEIAKILLSIGGQ